MALRRLSGAAVEAVPERAGTPLPAHALALLAGLTAAVFAQGAFYGAGQRLAGLILVVAAVLAQARRAPAPAIILPPGGARALGLAVVLAAWALLSASVAGDARRALGIVTLLAAVTVVAACCWRCTVPERDALARAVLGLGVLAALAGWAGVAWHASPWALVDQDLWRAAGALTYVNANAGLLAPLALLALARHADHRTPITAVTVCLLLAGLGATLSRGGALALTAGLIALALASGARKLLHAAWGPVAGALVALAGLLPSIPVTAPARPLVALAALLLGAAVAVAVAVSLPGPERRPRLAARLVAGVVLAGAVALASETVPAGRLTLDSPDRAGEVRAAFDLVSRHPVAGVGPAWSRYIWTDDDGRLRVARFVHNEYLQVLAELGAVGFVILVALFAAIGRLAWRNRTVSGPHWLWAGATAGLIAVAVHAALDFGWHVPAVVLTGAVLVGMSTYPRREEHACSNG